MDANSLAFTQYWRNSLADSDLGWGALKNEDISSSAKLELTHLTSGEVPDEIVEKFFEGEDEKTPTVKVVVRAKVFVSKFDHGKRPYGLPEVVTPIVFSAQLARDRRIYPTPCTIPRDLLEPQELKAFAIAHIDQFDLYLSLHDMPAFGYVEETKDEETGTEFTEDPYPEKWALYVRAYEDLFATVTEGWPSENDRFEQADYWLLAKQDTVTGTTRHILALYEHIRGGNPDVPLYEQYASLDNRPVEPCLPSNAAFASRLGHASDRFALASAQRDALSHLLVTQQGEILAVNGPPGTGKTTLLLSVVASLWAQAALDQADPPVILAASSNNQAVTNIIDAFGKDFAHGSGPFAGRWLPDLKSFGSYFPAIGKEDEQSKTYQTRSFFDTVESKGYIEHAKQAYLAAARQAFPGLHELTIDSAIKELHKALAEKFVELTAIDSALQRLRQANIALAKELGNAPEQTLTQRRTQLEAVESQKSANDAMVDRWEHFRAKESILYTLFSWIPAIAEKRLRLAKLALKPLLTTPELSDQWHKIDDIDTTMSAITVEWRQRLGEHQQLVTTGEAVLAERETAKEALAKTLREKAEEANVKLDSIDEIDAFADTHIRFPIFLLTTHYWEGRWLQEMAPLIPNLDEIRRKNGPVAVAKSWRRRMMLTPCCVSTFAMLPALIKVFRSNGSEYIADYLYNFIDLLIVDEAGQVLPEVAGASFALARRALVIGDTLQLDPIWAIPPHVDAGNLVHAKLIKKGTAEQEYETIADLGKTAASGSVMRIAQGATRYHYDIDLARGMFLYEHRRCFDDIIEYCNRLCYHGKLQKKRPDRPIQGNLPPMGYLHINGICAQNANHSRYNRLEAETIAAWISAHREGLEQQYGQPLAEILAVVTPFKGQVDTVVSACRRQGIPVSNGENGITVGTIHSLQGAERRIVIFSPAYSKHADGGFIDKKVSMLNVAVSRAKDSFLVFGDMDVFELMPESKPRGLLAEFLFKRPEQTLQFEVKPRQDLAQDAKNPYPITDAAEHDAFLMAAVTKASEEVHIVSPWLSLTRMKETGALSLLSEAAHRGVEIHIYTDYLLNEEQYGPGAIQRNRLKLLKAAEHLAAEQISVHFVRQVHSKIVVCDQNLYCVGSFNWFSASRNDRYARFEHSLVYRGKHLADEIRVLKENLKKRVVFFNEHGGEFMPEVHAVDHSCQDDGDDKQHVFEQESTQEQIVPQPALQEGVKRKGARWSNAEDCQLETLWRSSESVTTEQLAAQFGRTRTAIISRLVKIGLFQGVEQVISADIQRQGGIEVQPSTREGTSSAAGEGSTNQGSRWTTDDDRLLSDYWHATDGFTCREIGDLLGRSSGAIVARLVRIGVFPDRQAVREADRLRGVR